MFLALLNCLLPRTHVRVSLFVSSFASFLYSFLCIFTTVLIFRLNFLLLLLSLYISLFFQIVPYYFSPFFSLGLFLSSFLLFYYQRSVKITVTNCLIYIYRVSQEECARLREIVPYVKVYRYNSKHLYPKLNGYGNIGQRKVGASCGSKYLHS